ncbi:hypothetical protein BpHYR1_047345 [Brachionus plicatilis]|uniref:Uncharacterized protein n=1 Tax=Brachionus plicatilis TaxID=10195 RepID=A0A3M7SQQ5_BRAPC|nr:hypothetical protein BpHYR1_047345 [Brachionus plicatilis]
MNGTTCLPPSSTPPRVSSHYVQRATIGDLSCRTPPQASLAKLAKKALKRQNLNNLEENQNWISKLKLIKDFILKLLADDTALIQLTSVLLGFTTDLIFALLYSGDTITNFFILTIKRKTTKNRKELSIRKMNFSLAAIKTANIDFCWSIGLLVNYIRAGLSHSVPLLVKLVEEYREDFELRYIVYPPSLCNYIFKELLNPVRPPLSGPFGEAYFWIPDNLAFHNKINNL